METRDKKPTPEQIATAQETISEFFEKYSFGTYRNLSFEVFCICAMDEEFGLSVNAKKKLLDYLEAAEKVFSAAHVLADPAFLEQQYHAEIPIDERKAQAIRKAMNGLSKPFWTEEPDDRHIEYRQAYEWVFDMYALLGADKEDLLYKNLGLSFFSRYGLLESLDLLNDLIAGFTPCKVEDKSIQPEIASFHVALKELLSVTYLQSIARWRYLRDAEEGGGHASR